MSTIGSSDCIAIELNLIENMFSIPNCATLYLFGSNGPCSGTLVIKCFSSGPGAYGIGVDRPRRQLVGANKAEPRPPMELLKESESELYLCINKTTCH